MEHVRGAPYHPMTQGKIERWHQTLKNRILLENYYLPGDLEAQIGAFVVVHGSPRRANSEGAGARVAQGSRDAGGEQWRDDRAVGGPIRLAWRPDGVALYAGGGPGKAGPGGDRKAQTVNILFPHLIQGAGIGAGIYNKISR
jgi:hypothetical protein